MSDANRKTLLFTIPWGGGLLAAEFNVSPLGLLAVIAIAIVCNVACSWVEEV